MSKVYFVGGVFESASFGPFSILSYKDMSNIEIEFLNTGHKRVVTSGAISSRSIRDHMAPSVCGIGVIGGDFCTGGKPMSYKVWHSMIDRCYNTGNSYYHRYGGIGVTVCDDWLYFPFFKAWFDENYIDGYQLDKDLSCKPVYSEENCVFISRADNTKEMLARRNPKTFVVVKDGVTYKGSCRKEFILAHDLSQSGFSRLLSGKRKSLKGFSVPKC